MPTEPPAPRYRVVERGRRLEVIDTLGGDAVRPTAAAPTGPGDRWPTMPQQAGFDGRAVLVTHRWYDAKAPRRVLLDGVTAQRIGNAKGVAVGAATILLVLALAAPIVLAMLLLPLALLKAPVRERLRAAATGWLDRFDAPPGR